MSLIASIAQIRLFVIQIWIWRLENEGFACEMKKEQGDCKEGLVFMTRKNHLQALLLKTSSRKIYRNRK